jgi:hypothetical protein
MPVDRGEGAEAPDPRRCRGRGVAQQRLHGRNGPVAYHQEPCLGTLANHRIGVGEMADERAHVWGAGPMDGHQA